MKLIKSEVLLLLILIPTYSQNRTDNCKFKVVSLTTIAAD